MKNKPFKSKFLLQASLMLAFAALFCLTHLTSCGQRNFQTAPTKISNFKGQLIEGSPSNYNSEKGYVTLIVLTASWCPSCRAELPHLKKLDSQFGSRGFKIIMVSEDDSPQIALQHKNSEQINWTTFYWSYEIMNALGNPGVIPVSYLVNAQDSVVKIDVGGFSEKEMISLIEKEIILHN